MSVYSIALLSVTTIQQDLSVALHTSRANVHNITFTPRTQEGHPAMKIIYLLEPDYGPRERMEQNYSARRRRKKTLYIPVIRGVPLRPTFISPVTKLRELECMTLQRASRRASVHEWIRLRHPGQT